MGIKFPEKVLRLLEIRSIEKNEEGKEKKIYHFARLADEETFEANDFMLPQSVDPASLTVQTRYAVLLDVDGKFNRISLTPASEPSSRAVKLSPQQ
jgi:hypothetical protein